MSKPPLRPASLLAQAGGAKDPATGAVVPAWQPATTFARDADGALPAGYLYLRNAGPGDSLLDTLLAKLEGGAEALAFASGLAAQAALIEALPVGARVVAPSVMYHGGRTWLQRQAARGRIALSLFEPTRAGALEESLAAAPTALLWIEPAVNPTWDVIDIAAAAAAAKEAGALLAVDSTVAPPVTTRPLELGADVVFHSATKYLNGHSDVLAGILVAKTADALWNEVREVRKLSGGVLGAFEAWLLLRGLRTLELRFRRASESALALARHFEGHPRVERVLYPGLPSHPGHAVAARQMQGGFGGMLSILVAGGFDAAARVTRSVRVFLPATSLGGVESLIEHRKPVEPPDSPVPENLLRLSVGIEDPADLVADLERALAA